MAKIYDANKSYQWNQDDEFTITGGALYTLYLAIQQKMDTKEYREFLLTQKAAEQIQETFKNNVHLLKENKTEEKEEGA